jgi:hypothetical protein
MSVRQPYPNKIKEVIAHVDLSDMPDSGGTNTDHDARYYTEAEVDAAFLKLDQTTPQSVINGQPTFDQGLKITAGQDIRPSANSTTAINIAQADGTDWVTFDTTNKRVGIGTTSPTVALEVASNSASILFLNRSGVGTVAFGVGGYVASADLGIITNANGSNILFRTKSAGGVANDVLTLTSTNSVGIGTTAPSNSAMLDVASGVMSIVVGADNNVAVTRTNATNKSARMGAYHYTNAEEPVGIFLATSSSTANSVSFGGGSALFNTATQMSFYTAADTTTTTGTERLRIDSSGDIKIPADSKYLYFGAGDDASIAYDGTDFLFNSRVVGTGNYKFQNGNIVLTAGVDIRPSADSTTALNIANAAGTDFVVFDTTNSRVGINKTPAVALDVVGGITTSTTFTGQSVSCTSASDASIWSIRSGGSSTRLEGGATAGYFGTYSNHPLIIQTNNTERARIDTLGNFGIGATPLSPLHLEFTDSATNDVYNMFRIRRVSSGTVANEFGAGILFDLEDAVGTARNATRIHTRWVDATNLYPRIGFDIRVSGSLVEQVNLQDGRLVPTTNNDIDLGDSTHKFKDGYFAGKLTVDGEIDPTAVDFTQIATPANPAANHNKLYFKSDDKLYKLTSAGVESEVGGGGGGGETLAQTLALGNVTGGYDIAFNTNGDVITDGTQTSIDPYNRQLLNSNATCTFDWNGSGTNIGLSIQTTGQARFYSELQDDNGDGWFLPSTRALTDASDNALISLDDNVNAYLYYNSGDARWHFTKDIDASIQTIYAADIVMGSGAEITDGSNVAIDPYNRTLKDSSGNIAFTYSTYTAPQLNGLTTDGFVKTSSTNGTLTIDTNTYLTEETDPNSVHLDQTSNQSMSNVPTATVAGTDKVLVLDASDSDKVKTVTAQSIADLGGGITVYGPYSNNAEAIAGGRSVGDFYRTGDDPDTVCVVH